MTLLYLRQGYTGNACDLFYAPAVCLLVLMLLEGSRLLCKVFAFFGKHSTTMWLTHTFFCYYFYQAVRLVYGSRNAILDFLILLAMTTVTAVILDGVYRRMGMRIGSSWLLKD